MRRRDQVVRLGAIVRFASGQVDPREEPWASMIHLGPDNIEPSGNRIVGELKPAKDLGLISGKYEFDDEAIVYSKIRPNLNKVCVPRFRGICSADMYPLWADTARVDRDFLCQYMRSPDFVSRAVLSSMRTGMPKINRPDLERIHIRLPPLEEQRRIAEILRTWDLAIEKTEQLIAAKTTAFDSLALRLLSGRNRLGKVRSNWQSVALTDVADEITTRNGNRLGADIVMGVNKSLGMIPMKDHVRAADISRYKIVGPEAFAYNPMRLNIGSIAQNSHGRDVLVSPDYVAFEARPDSLMPAYFDHLRRTPAWGRFVKTAGSGGVRVRIYYDDLANFILELPSLDEQARIVALLDTGRRELAILEGQRDALAKQKRGLMQKLLSGEWPVNVPDSQEAAE